MTTIRLDRQKAPVGCRLVFEATGASEADIARALAAAQAVFDAADVHPYACAYANDLQYGAPPDQEMTAEQEGWAELWRVAEYAARDAGCPNWADQPAGFTWRLANTWPGPSRDPA